MLIVPNKTIQTDTGIQVFQIEVEAAVVAMDRRALHNNQMEEVGPATGLLQDHRGEEDPATGPLLVVVVVVVMVVEVVVRPLLLPHPVQAVASVRRRKRTKVRRVGNRPLTQRSHLRGPISTLSNRQL